MGVRGGVASYPPHWQLHGPAGGTKSFWSVTEKGQAFGKNVVSPESPRETQPHWFSAKGEELLRVMGVLE